VTQRYKSLLLCDTVNLCLASPVCPGYQGLRLRLSFVQQAKRKLADKAHLAPVSISAATPPDPSASFRPLPPLLSRAPRLPDLAKRGSPAPVRPTPLFKSASASDYTISAAASSGQTLHRSVSDKQRSGSGAHKVFRAYHAAGLGSSSDMTAATSQVVLDKSVGPLQSSGGRSGVIMRQDQVWETQQGSGVSAMLDKAVASREPSFSQTQGSPPPADALSHNSGLKPEAGPGSLAAADGLLDEAQQLQQKAALAQHSPSFLSQQDSGTAELYDSMLGPMYEQLGVESGRDILPQGCCVLPAVQAAAPSAAAAVQSREGQQASRPSTCLLPRPLCRSCQLTCRPGPVLRLKLLQMDHLQTRWCRSSRLSCSALPTLMQQL